MDLSECGPRGMTQSERRRFEAFCLFVNSCETARHLFGSSHPTVDDKVELILDFERHALECSTCHAAIEAALTSKKGQS